jgi:hypothetical protein
MKCFHRINAVLPRDSSIRHTHVLLSQRATSGAGRHDAGHRSEPRDIRMNQRRLDALFNSRCAAMKRRRSDIFHAGAEIHPWHTPC